MTQVDKPPPHPHDRAWLKWPVPDERPKMRWASRSSRDGHVEISNLTKKEMDAIDQFLCGASYIRCVDGRLWAYDALEPLPTAETDPICGPHWRSNGEVKQWGGKPYGEGMHNPGLSITALGAGLRSARERKKNQQFVTDCGFICLRSPRLEDGCYWEQWVLHSVMCAKGPLEKHMEQQKVHKLDWHQSAEAACNFLGTRVAFGSLDITMQRWALGAPD